MIATLPDSGPDPARRKSLRNAVTIAGIFLVALIVKLLYQAELNETFIFNNLIIDEIQHDSSAREIVRRGLVGKDAFYFAPLYPYILAAFYAIFGRDLILVKLAQAFIGAANVALMYLVGKEAFGKKRVGFLAAFLTLTYGVYSFYEGFLLKTTAAVFLTNLTLLLLFLARNRDKKKYWLLSGLCIGLTSLLRGNMLLVIPFILIWIVWEYRKKGLAILVGKIGIFCLGALMAISPATVHNWLAADDFIPTTYQGGTNFFIGNHSGATGIYNPLRPDRSMAELEYQDAVEIAGRALGHKPKPSEVSRYWFGRSFAFIRNEPGEFVNLTYHKLELFLNAGEVADAFDYQFFREFSSWLRLPLVPFGLISPLALMGIFISISHRRRHRLLYLYLLGSSLSVVLFFVFSRYRVPVVSGFILFAAYGLTELWSDAKHRRWLRVLLAGTFFTGCFFFSNQKLMTASQNSSYSNLGGIYLENRQYDLAIKAFDKALELQPEYPPALYNLGIALHRKGEYQRAVDYLQRVRKMRPDHPPIYHALGQVYYDWGKWSEAVKEFEKVLSLDPDNRLGLNVMAYNHLGTIYFYHLVDNEKAIRYFSRSLEISPAQPQAYQLRQLIAGS